MKASSVNRLCKALKAALNLAASHDDRITNAKAWTVGLAAIPEADDTESNLVLSDEQRRDVVSASYAISAEFGLYVEVHAATGARSGQIALLDVGDLHAGKEPKLMMPSSAEGQEPQDANPQADADHAQLGEAAEGRPQPDAMPIEPLLLLERRALERGTSIVDRSSRPRRLHDCRTARRSIACGTPRSRARCWLAFRFGWSRRSFDTSSR